MRRWQGDLLRGERVIVVRAFVKKIRATPKREIALARQRMDDWQDDE
jgi:phage-related protein